MERKIRVGIIFGGKSAEHEVSLQSAKNIIEAIDKNRYEVVLIGMDKKGRWYLSEISRYLLKEDDPRLIKLADADQEVGLIPGEQSQQLLTISTRQRIGKIDVVFPVLHGPYGEDGTVQGLLKLANIAFVGADVLGSAMGMDKDVMKRLFREPVYQPHGFWYFIDPLLVRLTLRRSRIGWARRFSLSLQISAHL
jgi:D-alanine-D-alanine ligase